jgi:hypothetical protein
MYSLSRAYLGMDDILYFVIMNLAVMKTTPLSPVHAKFVTVASRRYYHLNVYFVLSECTHL